MSAVNEKKFFVAVLCTVVFVLFAIPLQSFAQEGDKDLLTISIDKKFYYTGDVITVTANRGGSFQIMDPDFDLISKQQGSPPYTVLIEEGMSMWEKSGEYTILIQDGSETKQATFFVNVEKITTDDDKRISAESLGMVNGLGNAVDTFYSETQVQIKADIQNNQNFDQEFVFAIIISDEDGKESQPKWMTGMLTAHQKLTPSISWTPQYGGNYTITAKMWDNTQSMNNIGIPITADVFVNGEPKPRAQVADDDKEEDKDVSYEKKESIQKTSEDTAEKEDKDKTTTTSSKDNQYTVNTITVDKKISFDDVDSESDTVSSDETAKMTTSITNNSESEQELVFLIQIKNSDEVVVFLDQVKGTLSKGTSMNPEVTWMPTIPGTYTYEIFVWDSIDNANPLSIISESEFVVK